MPTATWPMSLMRGLAGSQPLDVWLNEIVWPLEKRIVDRDFVADGTGLALAEMISSGTTCASDHYWYPEVAGDMAVRAGFRLQLAVPVVNTPSAGLRNVDECIHQGVELHDQYRDQELIKVAFGPHSCYAVELKALRRVQTLADEIGADIHMHLHETKAEVADARARNGMTWIRVLSEIGLITPRPAGRAHDAARRHGDRAHCTRRHAGNSLPAFEPVARQRTVPRRRPEAGGCHRGAWHGWRGV